ncbi:bromodomain adjacent to zinc finger domain protein 2A isoform X2 [Dunckerocampus dactyliophorus]|uniref:bromodomain adjacent to zinc finger domain protein 2A isoform X2 n=1 Tax=Dunckerocampus dactyliophorus TaxID=161453 RepID=UPI002407221C|nr:bromodomain adjacent to zinc finger domain protein 2A isoform X2 [Dunckerocampus dactyliophorus]
MEANNHFNYGTHSSANSGLKLSSGDSLYTNGSSMSFPQQDMNGEMNVNGVTTVHGSGAPGSQPPSGPYPHISSHHQGNVGYLWGGQPQYSLTLAPSTGHGLHQKQPAPGMMQPLSQHHFQAHGQYQLNGDMARPQQPPAAGPSNMPPTGSQFWNRSSPGPQTASFTSRSMYGTFQSPSHSGISPSPLHQQQVSPPSQQHLHSHQRPPHLLPQHQQPQHYGVMPNGMPYYQQTHTSLPSPQHPKQLTPQGQIILPVAQNFTPPRDTEGAPSGAVTSSSTVQDGGSLRSGEKTPHPSNVSSSMQGHTMDENEANASHICTEETAVAQRAPSSSSAYIRHTSDHHSSEKPTAQQPEVVRGPAASTPPRTTHPASLSSSKSSQNKVLTPSQVSRAPAVDSPTASPVSTIGVYPDVKSTPPQSSSVPPPMHSSPPMGHDLKSLASAATEMMLPGSKHLLVGSSSSLPATHTKFCTPPGLTESSRPEVSGPPSASSSPSSESRMQHSVSGPLTAILAPAIVSTSSYSGSTPILSLQQMVQGSTLPLMPALKSNSSICDTSGSVHSSIASSSGKLSPGVLLSAGNKPAPVAQHDSLHTALVVGAGGAIASAALSPPQGHNSPSSAHESPSARPLSALPLLTTQASRTAPVSVPPALATVHPASSSEVVHKSGSGEHPASSIPVSVLNQLPDHLCHGNTTKALAHEKGTKAEEGPPQLEAHKDTGPHKSSDLPGQPLQTEQQSSNMQQEPISTGIVGDVLKAEQAHCPSSEHQTVETSFEHASHTASHYGSNSASSTLTRIHMSSFLDMSSNSSRIHCSSSFGNSVHLGNDTSRFASSSHTDEEESSVYDTTTDGGSFVDYSRDDTLDSTRELELSGAGQSMLVSSLNSTAFGVSHLCYEGHDTPDSSAVRRTTMAIETMTSPSFRKRDENFIAFSTPAQSPAVHPLQPVTDQVLSATGGLLKSPEKPCKPHSPKALWMRKSAPEEAKRKPRGRTPKVEKIKAEEEDDDNVVVAKGRRRRRASVKAEPVIETADKCEKTGSTSEEMDSITATIEAVLANPSAISSPFDKPKMKRARKQNQVGKDMKPPKQDAETAASDPDDNEDQSSTTGESHRRRVATEQQVQFPLMHGWKREIRVKKLDNRMKGETWYYTPCGRRMKQFPEIIKYLKKHQDSIVTREHFSFSPRMPVGDFYEERESPEGMKWFLLANEEIPSMIMAITGRRGRPPNPDKEKPSRARGLKTGQARRPGRPPKAKMIDFLSKVDAKLLKRLESKEALTEEEKEKMSKIKKKMKRKARMKRMEEVKMKKMREEKKRAKQETQTLEVKAGPQDPSALQLPEPASQSVAEPRKPGRRRSVKVEATPPAQQTDEERIAQGKRVLSARSKAKALAKAQAEAEAAARADLAAKRTAERRAQTQRRLEERKRQQLIAEELRKPTEDMCLTDHKPLPELSRVPGVVLSGTAFAHCLAVVEFLHGYGKLIGLNVPKDIPSLATLQEGLLGLGESQGEVQDLLIKLMEAALHDPGLPSYYQSVKILGDKLVELQLTRSTVSEVLRIFLESHGYETEVCNTLRTKTFHVLSPETKAAVLGFVVEELNGSNIVTSDIDNTLENISNYRKNKWIIEGKLRKLKAALARRTGRSEEQLCLEERRRSARVAEEDNLILEDSVVSERSSRRGRKEDSKLSDSESPTNASIPELERQIEKLTKRQAFFRKKLLQSSHSMRSVMLGQDRYRRRYLALPHLGGVLVEGPEELLTSGDVVIAEVPVTLLKKESKIEEMPVKTEDTPMATTPPHTLPSSPSSATPQAQTLSPEEDPLPGTASLMSSQRGRGRPRKIKPEVELHLRTAKIRRQRRSSVRSGGEDRPGSPVSACTQDLSQTAFLNWLSQSRHAVPSDTNTTEPLEGSQPEEAVKDAAENQGQWFTLLPEQPCDDNCLPSSPPKSPSQVQSTPPTLAAPLMQLDTPFTSVGETPADPEREAATEEVPSTSIIPDCKPPPLRAAKRALTTPARPGRRRRRGSRGSSPARRGPRGAAAKRRGRPATSSFQDLEKQYFTQLVVKPIPASMVRGWWWIKDPEELFSTLQALHPRGVREKILHKHLAKHMESLKEMCTKPINDPMFELKEEKKEVLIEALQQPWQVQEKAMETDINALQWVEDLEQRVMASDLHLKAPPPQNIVNDAESNIEVPAMDFQPYTIPEPDSTREDLQYYEHDADPRDDWIVRTKKEWSGLPRIATHPLDLAVLRLANLERNIERRYLKEPLWNPAEVMRLAPLTPTPGEEQPMDVISLESEITSRLRTWRQALDRCRSAPQLCLCLLQLEKAIAWERSVTKVTCQVCRKGDNDECLLLCDGCDRGCHMYCLKPKITQVPEGDWFCPTCVAKNESQSSLSKKRTRMKKKRYEENSSDDDTTPRRSSGMATRHKEAAAATVTTAASSSSRNSAEGGAAKRRRMTTRNQPDLTFCEIILMEMEAHADAWPFLEPVNPRLVPGYRRIVKNPMDFLTMRERLLQGGYCSCEEFAADAQLVFNNCELFNEDTSEVGMAGHSMRRFFESRWAEFYSNKDK